MKKPAFVLLLILWSIASHAQFSLHELQLMGGTSSTPLSTFDNQYQGIVGSAFLLDNWVAGDIESSKTGQHFNNLKLKIDLYKNKIYMNLHDTIYDLTDINNASQFVLYPNEGDTSKKLIFTNKITLPGVTAKVLQVLSAGPKMGLFKNAFKNPEDAQTGLYAAKEKRFMDYVHYYMLKDGTATEVTISKKNLEKLFQPADYEKIKAYLKQKGFSAGEEEGWAAAFNYYNSL